MIESIIIGLAVVVVMGTVLLLAEWQYRRERNKALKQINALLKFQEAYQAAVERSKERAKARTKEQEGKL